MNSNLHLPALSFTANSHHHQYPRPRFATMKSTLLVLMIILIAALVLVFSSSSASPTSQRSPIITRRHLLETSFTGPNHDHFHHSNCGAFPGTSSAGGRTAAGYSRSLCLQLQEMINSRPPPRRRKRVVKSSPQEAAAGGGEEIDPRYGVEKRLVPSGPNPLHN